MPVLLAARVGLAELLVSPTPEGLKVFEFEEAWKSFVISVHC